MIVFGRQSEPAWLKMKKSPGVVALKVAVRRLSVVPVLAPATMTGVADELGLGLLGHKLMSPAPAQAQ